MVKDGIYLSGRYQVLSKIGAGGMADVYKAKDCMLNRYVAVKVLKKEYREDENFVKKFRSEAQAAAGLLNPNIVNVYDVGEDRGLYYMVMELVEGITLKEYVQKKGKLSSKESSHHTQRYQTAEYYHFQRRKGKGYRFWYCKGDNIADSQHQCNGIGTLCISGAGTGRLV